MYAFKVDIFAYVDFLKEELKKLQEKRPAYSLRSFARKLGLSPGYLSDILAENKKLSIEKAAVVAAKLNWDPRKAQRFNLMVQYAWSTESLRPAILKKISLLEYELFSDFYEIPITDLEKIAEWYYYAVLELTSVHDFTSEPEWIAKRLGLSEEKVRQCIQRLIEVGLLRLNEGKYEKVHANYTYESAWTEKHRETVNRTHISLLPLAENAIKNHGFQDRSISGITLAVNSKKVPEAIKMIGAFRRQMMAFLDEGESNCVYRMNVHFFRLDQGSE